MTLKEFQTEIERIEMEFKQDPDVRDFYKNYLIRQTKYNLDIDEN